MNHIALILPGFVRIGGAERQLILLATGLRKRGWRVSVVALSGTGGEVAAELLASGITFISLHMRKGLADPHGWICFRRWLRRERPDVVHAHLPHAVWLARWSRLAAPVRVLLDTIHTSSTGTLARRLAYRSSNWLPDMVTAVSQAVAEMHLRARMVTQNKLAVLPNGVNVAGCEPDTLARDALRREFGLEDGFLWLAVGRLDPVKDYPTLIRATLLLPEPVHLVIAGTGPDDVSLRRLSQQLGLEHRIRFLGFEPHVRRWIQAADGFVLSSLWEGLPMGLLEAAACSLPAVATDVPGTREVIVDGVTGLLALPGDATSLSGAMTRMMQAPPEQCHALGGRAQQFVVERFSLDAVLDRWEGLYADLLLRNPVPARWGKAGPRA